MGQLEPGWDQDGDVGSCLPPSFPHHARGQTLAAHTLSSEQEQERRLLPAMAASHSHHLPAPWEEQHMGGKIGTVYFGRTREE